MPAFFDGVIEDVKTSRHRLCSLLNNNTTLKGNSARRGNY